MKVLIKHGNLDTNEDKNFKALIPSIFEATKDELFIKTTMVEEGTNIQSIEDSLNDEDGWEMYDRYYVYEHYYTDDISVIHIDDVEHIYTTKPFSVLANTNLYEFRTNKKLIELVETIPYNEKNKYLVTMIPDGVEWELSYGGYCGEQELIIEKHRTWFDDYRYVETNEENV